jgi:predicted dehydrogenase
VENDLTRRGFFQGAGVSAAALARTASLKAQSSSRTVRIGVVGGGFGSQWHWHIHPNCKVAAVCDLRPDRLQVLSEVYRCGNTYRSFREFLKHKELDAVSIFTPSPLHVWMATESMKAGKHVISAVPAGMSLAELEQLLECVKRTGRRYMMAETSYYRPEAITCREWSQQGKFGTIFYSEAEYHHEGLKELMFDERGFPTWRHGLPPMAYSTHSTGLVVPVTGERLVEVQAVGWGDDHEILQTNQYKNPFWNETGFFKTSGGHSSRIDIWWHAAVGGCERGSFYGSRMSYIMMRPEKSPNTVIQIGQDGKTTLDSDGYPQGKVSIEAYSQPNHQERLPEPLRVKSSHGGAPTFITHEFVSAILEDRHPTVNVWEAIAYTLPGIVAHDSALRGGEPMKIKDFGKAPA